MLAGVYARVGRTADAVDTENRRSIWPSASRRKTGEAPGKQSRTLRATNHKGAGKLSSRGMHLQIWVACQPPALITPAQSPAARRAALPFHRRWADVFTIGKYLHDRIGLDANPRRLPVLHFFHADVPPAEIPRGNSRNRRSLPSSPNKASVQQSVIQVSKMSQPHATAVTAARCPPRCSMPGSRTGVCQWPSISSDNVTCGGRNPASDCTSANTYPPCARSHRGCFIVSRFTAASSPGPRDAGEISSPRRFALGLEPPARLRLFDARPKLRQIVARAIGNEVQRLQRLALATDSSGSSSATPAASRRPRTDAAAESSPDR